jgi:exonuclease VII small subunit
MTTDLEASDIPTIRMLVRHVGIAKTRTRNAVTVLISSGVELLERGPVPLDQSERFAAAPPSLEVIVKLIDEFETRLDALTSQHQNP